MLRATFKVMSAGVHVETIEKEFDSSLSMYRWLLGQADHLWLEYKLESVAEKETEEV